MPHPKSPIRQSEMCNNYSISRFERFPHLFRAQLSPKSIATVSQLSYSLLHHPPKSLTHVVSLAPRKVTKEESIPGIAHVQPTSRIINAAKA